MGVGAVGYAGGENKDGPQNLGNICSKIPRNFEKISNFFKHTNTILLGLLI